MKKILIGLSVLVILFFSGCGARTVFYDTKDAPVDEKNMAIIIDDYFHYPWSVKALSKLNKRTGKFEEIFNYPNKKQGPSHPTYGYVLVPGIYKITYGRKFKPKLESWGSGQVELKAGHKYRVNHYLCMITCSPRIATAWFEDITTGEVVSGYKLDDYNKQCKRVRD